MTPVTAAPPSRAARAVTPMSPTAPPPYTMDQPRAARPRPVRRASARRPSATVVARRAVHADRQRVGRVVVGRRCGHGADGRGWSQVPPALSPGRREPPTRRPALPSTPRTAGASTGGSTGATGRWPGRIGRRWRGRRRPDRTRRSSPVVAVRGTARRQRHRDQRVGGVRVDAHLARRDPPQPGDGVPPRRGSAVRRARCSIARSAWPSHQASRPTSAAQRRPSSAQRVGPHVVTSLASVPQRSHSPASTARGPTSGSSTHGWAARRAARNSRPPSTVERRHPPVPPSTGPPALARAVRPPTRRLAGARPRRPVPTLRLAGARPRRPVPTLRLAGARPRPGTRGWVEQRLGVGGRSRVAATRPAVSPSPRAAHTAGRATERAAAQRWRRCAR